MPVKVSAGGNLICLRQTGLETRPHVVNGLAHDEHPFQCYVTNGPEDLGQDALGLVMPLSVSLPNGIVIIVL